MRFEPKTSHFQLLESNLPARVVRGFPPCAAYLIAFIALEQACTLNSSSRRKECTPYDLHGLFKS
ncbi:hypothetical protein DVH24_006043 [Malus domestica]|uniref:Uncharacterized protein n=1 Tax=Malus domestica TaxID=3750 RepID=A0A498J330_MALDO|nr:hypothetical protein DVH24_006043 [Malus domestica]